MKGKSDENDDSDFERLLYFEATILAEEFQIVPNEQTKSFKLPS